ncbi:hypothetical protein IWX90DRAFT_501164 [Phyllosticta citrichinensis]|uniref:Nephrocystin 3-like N-terminal domain-containing protein n=1 Tax=Phyllosticta citrichinensis TaxID=1130410 RepID=A0ABR1XVN0_9PEZI
MIVELSSEFTNVFIVMDALDECTEGPRWKIFEFISALTLKVSGAKFFITSRPESSIRRDFNGLEALDFEIDVAATRNDMEEYVKDQLQYLTQPLQPGEPPKRRNLCVKEEQTKDVLSSIPGGLYDTYERILEQIRKKTKPKQRLASKCLMWVLKAKKQPFKIDELICAIATDANFTMFGQILEKREDYKKQDILDACLNLLILEGETVRPVHYSLAEFFEQEKTIKNSALAELRNPQLMEARIANTCLVFLKLYHAEDSPVKRRKTRGKGFHLIRYWALFLTNTSSLLQKNALKTFRIRYGPFVAKEATAKDFLYITQLCELSILTEDERWNTRALHRSILAVACAKGPIDRVRKLVDLENIPVPTSWSPLRAAVDIIKKQT